MVGRLLEQRIEVARAQNAIALKEGNFPAGTYVIRLDQPYRNYAVDLLSPQVFPKDKGEPYDDVSWEFPANFYLAAIPTADASIRSAALTPLKATRQQARAVSGVAPVSLRRDT